MIEYYGAIDGKLVQLEALQPDCWINISPSFDHEQIEELASSLDIPIDFLTDSLDIDERSRYEKEEEIRLIVINTPILNEEEAENDAIYITVPIGIILHPSHVITITSFVNPVIEMFLDGKVKNVSTSDKEHFVLQLFEQTVYYFLLCLKKLNLKRSLIEQELFNSSRNAELKQLLRIEKSLVYFVNSLSSNELLKMKMKRTDFLNIAADEDKSDLFEDIIIDNSQALEMANVHTTILSGTMESYASIISNNMNVFIHRLTIITIALMVPTLVASFFGMNVPVPMANNASAFPVLILISIAIGLLLVWFFRRKNMF